MLIVSCENVLCFQKFFRAKSLEKGVFECHSLSDSCFVLFLCQSLSRCLCKQYFLCFLYSRFCAFSKNCYFIEAAKTALFEL